jgi:predicted ATP-binding protein involved in virulence
MRLNYLRIERFKNLDTFEIDFNETSAEPVTIVFGRNGSGKSNLFEALVIIFRDLIQESATVDFGYDLRYTLHGGNISVRILNPSGRSQSEASPHAQFTSKEGDAVSSFSFTAFQDGTERRVARKDIKEFLPRYIVTYYSGVSNRMEHHFYRPQLEFRDQLLKGNVIPLRPLFHAKPIHSQFALTPFS